MERYEILDNETTRDCCEDLIGKVLKGETEGIYIKVYEPNDNSILLLPCEVIKVGW